MLLNMEKHRDMRHYLYYLTAATLIAVWAISKYTDDTPGNFSNILPVIAAGIIFYKLITTEPARYGRSRFRQ
jgi:hypothetical protein